VLYFLPDLRLFASDMVRASWRHGVFLERVTCRFRWRVVFCLVVTLLYRWAPSSSACGE